MVVDLVVAVALLSLAVAVVALFAMVGELGSRVDAMSAMVEQGGVSAGGDWAEPVDAAVVGTSPATWPDELAFAGGSANALLVILSTSCTSCRHFAGQGLASLMTDGAPEVGVVVSCATPEKGQSFVREYPDLATAHGVFVDVMGDWTQSVLGIDSSPTSILLQGGEAVAAYTMSSPGKLRELIGQAEYDDNGRVIG